jgi:hypothetical protein
VDCGLILDKDRASLQKWLAFTDFWFGIYFPMEKSADTVHKPWTAEQGWSMVVRTVARMCSSPETELVAGSGLKASPRVRGNREEESAMLAGCRRGQRRGRDGHMMRLCDSGQSHIARVVLRARTRGNRGGKWCSVKW